MQVLQQGAESAGVCYAVVEDLHSIDYLVRLIYRFAGHCLSPSHKGARAALRAAYLGLFQIKDCGRPRLRGRPDFVTAITELRFRENQCALPSHQGTRAKRRGMGIVVDEGTRGTWLRSMEPTDMIFSGFGAFSTVTA